MSLSNALANAVSGIVAASRGTEVVASNPVSYTHLTLPTNREV